MRAALGAWTPPDMGALFVVSGPSGTGKSTLVKGTLERIPGIRFSVSATTRAPRGQEKDGVEYHFVERERFLAMRDGGELLEWAEVHGNFYGTPAAPVRQALARGESVLLEIDTQGAEQVRKILPEAVTIFVLPPDMASLEARLRARSTDSEAVIAKRLHNARGELARAGEFDYVVLNDQLDTAQAAFEGIFLAELSRTARRASWVGRFVVP